jgi:hypothetical protein
LIDQSHDFASIILWLNCIFSLPPLHLSLHSRRNLPTQQAIGAMEEQIGQEAAAAAAAVAQPPVNLRCPITQQLLVDPVILVESAQTYERAAIQEWLDRGNKKDPMSGV